MNVPMNAIRVLETDSEIVTRLKTLLSHQLWALEADFDEEKKGFWLKMGVHPRSVGLLMRFFVSLKALESDLLGVAKSLSHSITDAWFEEAEKKSTAIG